MSIQSEVNRIKSNISDTYDALGELGADMPTERNSTNLPDTVSTVKAVRFDTQELTEAQQEQVRHNIGLDNINNDYDSEYIISDPEGNAIAKISADGLVTTKVNAKVIVIEGRDVLGELELVRTELASKAQAQHTHEGYAKISDLNSKADSDHTHEGYATTTELDDKASKDHTHEGYASSDHTHEGYASSDHTHEGYAKTTDLESKAEATHTHSEYATTEHEHSEYLKEANIESLRNHQTNKTIHVTAEEKASWFDGKYESLENAPNIAETDDESFKVVDPSGNIVAEINADGIRTHQVNTEKLLYKGKDFDTIIAELREQLYNELVEELTVGNPAYGTTPSEQSGTEPGDSGSNSSGATANGGSSD